MTISFREAGVEDWREIWPIFQAVVSTGDTYPYPADIAEDEAFAIWMKVDRQREATYVALVEDEVVGTAYVRANGVGLTDHIANAGWMVSPEHRGKGIGRLFGKYVISQARSFGYSGMQFNAVVASNAAAISLWKSLGFEIVGTVPDAFRHVSDGLTPLHVMYRQL